MPLMKYFNMYEKEYLRNPVNWKQKNLTHKTILP